MVASAIKKDIKKTPWVLILAEDQSTIGSAACDKAALVVAFHWLFQQALVSGHKWPTYKKLASSGSGDVYKASSACCVNDKQCQLGEHKYFRFSKTDNAYTNSYDSVAGDNCCFEL